jgi:hypothetical protein
MTAPRTSGSDSCAAPPPTNLGLDAYRNLGQLSFLDLVSRASSQLTADPAGNNKDWTNVARPLSSGGRVLLDQAGPGIVTFLRMQESIGGPWQLSVDGTNPLVFSSADMGQQGSAPFPWPLSFNPDQSHGSTLMMAPIPFQQSVTLSSASANGNFYSILRRLPYGTPIPTGTQAAAAQDIAARLKRGPSAFLTTNLATSQGQVRLKAHASNQIADLQGQGSRQVRLLHFQVPADEAVALGESTLRIWWDGEQAPSVDAPIKFLAGDGAGVYQPAGRPLVDGLMAKAGGSGGNSFQYDLWWPMPYQREARIAIIPNGSSDLGGLSWQVGTEPFNVPNTWWAPLHATYTAISNPVPGQDMTFLDVTGSGRIVGTVVNFGKVGGTLEGDPRIYLDDANTPQVQATGTEEWGLGGNYWRDGQQVSLPLGGLPSADNNPSPANVDGASLYRFLVADSVPFNRHARVNWEHGVYDTTTEPYRSVIIWYGTPTPTAIRSDQFAPGTASSSADHQFRGTGLQTTPITAGYAYRPDAPAMASDVMASTGNSSFTMAVSPAAAGAFLRRTYDAASSNQRADVYVDGHLAGTWYNAGGFSETDRVGVARRLVDDEFPLPPALIAGKASIHIELRNHPVAGLSSGPWTATHYEIYSLVPRSCAP